LRRLLNQISQMKKFLNNLSFTIMLLISTIAFSQETITGTVTDDANMPLPGATILVKGAQESTTTDVNGNFTLTTTSTTGEIMVSFLGFGRQTIPFTITPGEPLNISTITLASNAEELDSVIIVGSGVVDLVENRRTPVAASTINRREIQEKSGNQEFPEIMKNTPSVYVTSQAGGYGDSQMYVRGFDQTNTAFLLNGQPINGMEDGNMYWSNWSGMTDVANTIQVQRGLGSSKLAISSVGGTVNIVTKATDLKRGGFAQSLIGNDDYIKTTLGYNTGLMENGWGASVMLTKWSGDGYNRGTRGEGYNYFVSVGFKPNEKHKFNFLLFGAPQEHDQNFTKPIESYLTFGRKYNNNYGFIDGDYLSERTNYYHKPVANFNWDYEINSDMNLSTVLYASWGRGGGTGNWGSGKKLTPDKHIDFEAIRDNNRSLPGGIGSLSNGGYAIRNSVNNHAWYGVVSNFNHDLTENLSYNAGVDLRTYKGNHYREISNYVGLNGFQVTDNKQYPEGYIVTEQYSANPWSAFGNNPADNQKVNYDYDERINYGGIFGQLEYATTDFSAYVQGAVSSQSHVRWDRFGYVEADEKSEKVNNTGYNIKGGANYNISEQHSVFVNAGIYSKQPYHDNIYLNFGNDVNPLTKDERITGLEAGYRFRSQFFDANVNAYRTTWQDRVTTTSNTDATTQALVYTNNSGLSQLHTGLELDFVARPVEGVSVRGFASLGDWKYDKDVYVRKFDEDQNLLSEAIQDVEGSKVGAAAQTTFGLGAAYKITKGLSIDADWRSYSDLYADVVIKDNIELPAYDLFDAGITYNLKFTETSLTLRANVNNVFDEVFISEMTSGTRTTDKNPKDPAGGTYLSSGSTYRGLATNNNVFFGNGRTWNFSMRFNF
jgi:iron complex outermembrane receptor protein